jgi:hypothetical protein
VKEWNQTFHFTDLPKKNNTISDTVRNFMSREKKLTHIASLKLKGVAKGSQAG